MIQGVIQFVDPNKFGYTPSIKVNGVKYGGDVKGSSLPDGIQQGDAVEFEAFESAGSNGKVYPKYKAQTLRKIAASGVATPPATVANGQGAGRKASVPQGGGKSAYAAKESYWSDKAEFDKARAEADKAKEPRIAYFAALERAIALADVALRNEALPLGAKASKKLDTLTAFIDEQVQRFIERSYAQGKPVLGASTPDAEPEEVEAEEEAPGEEELTGEQWS